MLLHQVIHEEPRAPRRLNDRIPRDLDTICLKAMAKEPGRRYATAWALADDLRRYLKGEPILARPVGRLERLVRWCRRQPAAAAALLFLATTAVALAAGLVAVNTERTHTQEALAGEKDAPHSRGGTAATSSDALDAMTSEVIDDLLARQTVLSESHKKFLERALADYERFAHETGEDESGRAGVAGAYMRMGQILSRLGQAARAENAYRASLQRYAHLAADFPTETYYRYQVGTSLNDLGNLLAGTKQVKQAEATFRQAIRLYQELSADNPQESAYRRELARNHNCLGLLFSDTSRTAAALAEYRQALSVQKQLVTEFPKLPAYRAELASSEDNVGNLMTNIGQNDASLAAHRRALTIRKELVAQFPKVAGYQQALARTYNNLGNVLSDMSHAGDAQKGVPEGTGAPTTTGGRLSRGAGLPPGGCEKLLQPCRGAD